MTGQVLQLDPAAHKVADALLPWFVNGTLEGDELAFVQQHLSGCKRCQREVEWLRGLHAACVAGEASPGAAPVLRRLRRRLEELPRRRRGTSVPNFWSRLPPWSGWAVATPLAVMLAVGAWLLPAAEGTAPYRTLGAASAKAVASGNIVVVFDPATTEADLRRILQQAGARIVDGPTESNAYVLAVPAQEEIRALQALRAQRATLLAVQLGPQTTR